MVNGCPPPPPSEEAARSPTPYLHCIALQKKNKALVNGRPAPTGPPVVLRAGGGGRGEVFLFFILRGKNNALDR